MGLWTFDADLRILASNLTWMFQHGSRLFTARFFGLFLSVFTDSAIGSELRREGLWETFIFSEGRNVLTAIRIEQCVTPSTDLDLLLALIPDQEHCQRAEMQRSKGRMEIRTDCRIRRSPIKSKMVLSGNLDDGFSGMFQVSYGPPKLPGRENIAETQFRSHWLSKCPMDMKPGDMRLSNGIIVNVPEDKKAHDSEED